MNLSEEQIERRKPVWLALSDLFLDTELQEDYFRFMAQALSESGYSIEEFESILMDEVFPICIPNLISMAGEWRGFDDEWLYQSILESRPPNLFSRLLCKARFWRIKSDWNKVLKAYRSL